VGTQPDRFSSVISLAGLLDLVDDWHKATNYPNTFARGTKRIDYIFGTEQIRNTAYQVEYSLSAMVIQATTEQFLSDVTLKRYYAQKSTL
jgi:predicted solute-binding protein